MSSNEETIQQILGLEAERCRAISEQDWPALEKLLAPDLTHTHMNGNVQDREAYLKHVKANPRVTERGSLGVRLYGDTAVINGRMFNRTPNQAGSTEAEVIQVWRRNDGSWQQIAFQASRVPVPN